MRPHRQQPIRLCRPWDSPGKNTGVGCHLLLHCVKVKSESEVAQSRPTPSDPMDCSLPGSSIHGIFLGKSTGVACHCLLQIYPLVALFLEFWTLPRHWEEEKARNNICWFLLHTSHQVLDCDLKLKTHIQVTESLGFDGSQDGSLVFRGQNDRLAYHHFTQLSYEGNHIREIEHSKQAPNTPPHL